MRLKNTDNSEVELVGWLLVDRAGNERALNGKTAADAEHKIVLPTRELPLNNSGGDEIRLVNPGGNVEDLFTYNGQQTLRSRGFAAATSRRRRFNLRWNRVSRWFSRIQDS